MISPPTYPMRPVNGGRLELAPSKIGIWRSEPKYNGYRSPIHVPTGTMFNRHNKPLSIAKEFKYALQKLRKLCIEWADVEALERRHSIGRGTLIILDVITVDPYEERKRALMSIFEIAPLTPTSIANDEVYVSPFFDDARQLYESLKSLNNGVIFYEGIICKRSLSAYKIQLQSDSRETTDWVKHRFV